MNQLLDVKRDARTLVGDPDGDWADDEYILPFINIAYTRAINYLMNTCAPFITRKVAVPAVPAGTTDWTPFQVAPATGEIAAGQTGAPLLGLINPLEIWWKVQFQPENNYCLAKEEKDLPFITPSNYIVGQRVYWEWIGNKINTTPLSFIADFLVKGEFLPPALKEDTDYLELDPAMAPALGFATAALIGGSRVAQSYIVTWQGEAEKSFDDISARLTRKEQGTSQRVGRMGGRRRRR